MEEKHQQQQQTVLLQPQVVQSADFVYADVPLVRIRRLANLQYVIASFLIGVYVLITFFSGGFHWFSASWDILFACLIIACGIIAKRILKRRNRATVQATAILSVIAAVLAAITLLVCIVLMSLYGVEMSNKNAELEMQYQHHYYSSNATDSVNGTYYGHIPWVACPHGGIMMQLRYFAMGVEMVFFIAELVAASLLASVTLGIMRNAKLVPANPPPVVTTVVCVQT